MTAEAHGFRILQQVVSTQNLNVGTGLLELAAVLEFGSVIKVGVDWPPADRPSQAVRVNLDPEAGRFVIPLVLGMTEADVAKVLRGAADILDPPQEEEKPDALLDV